MSSESKAARLNLDVDAELWAALNVAQRGSSSQTRIKRALQKYRASEAGSSSFSANDLIELMCETKSTSVMWHLARAYHAWQERPSQDASNIVEVGTGTRPA